MKVTEQIARIIDRFPDGYVFTYSDFLQSVDKKEAIIKALNRMVSAGKIRKLSKGRYYKPEITPFGELSPSQYEVVKDLLEQNKDMVGYLTGYSIYNKLGLTTQVSNTIQIGRNDVRPNFKRGKYTINFVRQKNTITKENYRLLQILDAIRYIKKIPDSTVSESCQRLLEMIKGLNKKQIILLTKLAQKYPPSSRALLGALLDESGLPFNRKELSDSLNPITQYKFLGQVDVLTRAQDWNIV